MRLKDFIAENDGSDYNFEVEIGYSHGGGASLKKLKVVAKDSTLAKQAAADTFVQAKNDNDRKLAKKKVLFGKVTRLSKA